MQKWAVSGLLALMALSEHSPAPGDEFKPVVAMIHAAALPGTPRHRLPMDQIIRAAVAEARLYQDCGVNCLMIENMHDTPYLRGHVGPEIVASMTMVAQAVRAGAKVPVGLQILAGADIEAMAVAHAANLDFIRVECFTFAHVADEGIHESSAAKLLRYRRMIDAGEVQVWTDIKKKHASHALTADISIGEVAEAAEYMGAETIIVTGTSTGRPPSVADVAEARLRCQAPVFVGSGVGIENVADLLGASDGVIVGSYFKRDGYWMNPPDKTRVCRFMEAVTRLHAPRRPPTVAPDSRSAGISEVARQASSGLRLPVPPKSR